MTQLEGLMRMLKNQQTSSPRSTPNSSPRSGKSPPLPQGPSTNSSSSRSAPPTPMQGQQVININTSGSNQTTEQLVNDVRSSFSGGNGANGNVVSGGGVGGQRIRNDLHYAADSVTSAMSSLVRELNTGKFFFCFILL